MPLEMSIGTRKRFPNRSPFFTARGCREHVFASAHP